VNAAVRDEAFFLCEVEECAVCYAGLFGYWAAVVTGRGPGILCTVGQVYGEMREEGGGIRDAHQSE